MNIRRGLAASILAAGLLTMTACGTELAGSPVPVAVTPTSLAPTTGAATTSSPSTTADPQTEQSPTDDPTTDASPTDDPGTVTDESTTDAPGTDATATPDTTSPDTTPFDTTSPDTTTGNSTTGGTTAGTVDAATKRWVTGMCTDMGAVYTAVLQIPKATEASGLSAYRQAYVDYYTTLHQSAAQALDDASGAQPPSVTGGAEIHQTFVRYLTGLADLSESAATLVQGEGTTSDVSADILQVSHEMENLSTKVAGPTEIKSPELAAAVQADPACADFGK